METAENIHIFTIPCYYKRQIRFRAEVADTSSNTVIYRQDWDGVWEKQPYNSIEAVNPYDLMQYESKANAIKAAQDFVEQLKTQ